MVKPVIGALACLFALHATAHAQGSISGRIIFQNKGNCISCHGPGGEGTMFAPSLRDAVWLNIDGSVKQITRLIRTGVPRPKKYPGMMPPMGGANLTNDEVEAVAQFVADLRTAPVADAAQHEHADSTAAADSAGKMICGCCQGRGGMNGMGRMRGMRGMPGMQTTGQQNHEH